VSARLVPALTALLALVVPAAALAAPLDGDQPVRIEQIDAADHPQVRVTVSAPAVDGDLPAEAFALTEDGSARDVEVSRVRSADLEVVLLLDATGSMRDDPLEAAKEAATSFVRQLPGDTTTTVLAYDTDVSVLSAPSNNVDAHIAGIERLEASGRTAMYDALAASLEHFSDDPDAKQAIILLTDGEDNASSTPLDDITATLEASGVTLYAVEFMTDYTDSAALEQLVAATGGERHTAEDPAALNAVYDALAAQLVNQYELGYTSASGGTTELAVTLDHQELTGRDVRQVDLPAVAEPATAPDEAPVLQVLSVNTDNHPDVVVRVLAPRQLRGDELDAGAFTIVEGGIEREVEAAQVTQLDLDVVLAIDTSGSMRGESMEQAKAAAVQFVASMPTNTRVAVHAFDSEPTLVQDFTDDTAALTAAIDSLQAGGHTALYDTGVAAAEHFDLDRNAVRSVIVLSDGADTSSSASLATAAERLAGTGASVHAVELRNGSTDPEALAALVRPARGTVLAADDPAALASLYTEMAADLANQYLLHYRSTGHGTTELQVGVDAAGVQAQATETVELPPMSRVQSLLASPAALMIGAALCYAAMALIILLLLAPPEVRTRLAPARAGSGSGGRSGSTVLAGVADWATGVADRRLDSKGRRQSINRLLEKAGVNLRPAEFVVLIVCAAVAGAGVGTVLSGVLLGAVLCAAATIGGYFALRLLADRRQAAFTDQLSDTLQLLASSLRAGYSILQAVDAVAREADKPTSEEFRRLVVETRLGRDLGEALHAMGDRVGNQDFEWVVQAIAIHREVGGDLADVLDTVAETIRERGQIRRQVKALSAEGRLSAYVLLALPFAVGGFVYLGNREYILELTQHVAGYLMLVTGAVLMTAGALWLRKIVRIEF
jgi:tight adherence protein B